MQPSLSDNVVTGRSLYTRGCVGARDCRVDTCRVVTIRREDLSLTTRSKRIRRGSGNSFASGWPSPAIIVGEPEATFALRDVALRYGSVTCSTPSNTRRIGRSLRALARKVARSFVFMEAKLLRHRWYTY